MQFLEKVKARKTMIGIIGGVVLLAAVAVVLWFTVFSGEWILKVNGHRVKLDEFNDLYYAQARTIVDNTNSEIDKFVENNPNSQIPPKKAYLNNEFLDSKILYFKALDEGYASNKDVKTLTEFNKYTIIMRFYMLSKFKNKVAISSKEISDEYQKHKAELKNAPIEQAEAQLRNYLTQKKIEAEQKKKIAELENAAKIDRNEDLINKISDPDKAKRPTSGTLVKISGKKIDTKEITVEYFNDLYYQQIKSLMNATESEIDKAASDPNIVASNPFINKKNFLDQMIQLYLFSEDARNEGMLAQKDLIALINSNNEQITYLYFLKDRYAKEAAPTDQEVSEQYEQYKGKLPPNMLPDQAIMMIRSRIEQQKLSKKVGELLSDLKDRWTIEKNIDVLDKK